MLAVDSLAFQKLLQAALTKLQENCHQYSPSPFRGSKHTGRFPGRADREILGPALFLQAWVKGSSGTNESSKKQKAEVRMNTQENKSTTRKDYRKRPRCGPSLPGAWGAWEVALRGSR